MDRKNSILIVEDHALTLFALKASLKSADFIDKIQEASCAKDAYEILENNKISLIIMDIGLPDINGIEATKFIKE
ncbi:response regulator transcription factor, partial [bacterium]|nr:response regulator transcription factor [bacterium]